MMATRTFSVQKNRRSHSVVEQVGQLAGLITQRSRVQIPPTPPKGTPCAKCAACASTSGKAKHGNCGSSTGAAHNTAQATTG
jgi:hypothetical protein